MHVPRAVLLLAFTLVLLPAAYAQNSPSLAEAARQARLQKQKDAKPDNSAASSADPDKSPKKVVTNDDIPESVASIPTAGLTPRNDPSSSGSRKLSAEQWKTLIQAQQKILASMQRAMDRLQSSIRYPEACVVDCAQRVERQRAKEQQLESMQARLAEQQKRLEELQEAARKQGFGSSVYEP
jgi:predicted TIM-barrel fold metal-dependent hydrolase